VSNTKNELNIISIKNYPNPFNPTTNLEYGISELGYVSLKVYDMMGREVVTLVNEKKNAGIHSVKFDGSQLSSGIYYYTLAVNGIRMETKSMVLMK
jgi:flagellar hook assembly protein FlgD